MLQVLLAEYRLLDRDVPVNAQRLILDVVLIFTTVKKLKP